MDEKVTLVQREYDPAQLCLHQTLSTSYTDSMPGMLRVFCRECGKTIEIPTINLVQNTGAFEGIVNQAFGNRLTS